MKVENEQNLWNTANLQKQSQSIEEIETFHQAEGSEKDENVCTLWEPKEHTREKKRFHWSLPPQR